VIYELLSEAQAVDY
jgi:ankyrin repeat protein